jgi:hypothetical protein
MTGTAHLVGGQPADPPPERPPVDPVPGRELRPVLPAPLPGLDTLAPDRRPILAVHAPILHRSRSAEYSMNDQLLECAVRTRLQTLSSVAQALGVAATQVKALALGTAGCRIGGGVRTAAAALR